MTLAKITITALITISATASFAGTSCHHKINQLALGANTNPVAPSSPTASSNGNAQAAVR